MPSHRIWSPRSQAAYDTLDPRLQKVCDGLLAEMDVTILEGHRDQAAQEAAVAAGNSKVHWPEGKHNGQPSKAVDVAPYPVDWGNKVGFAYMAGIAKGLAAGLGFKLRWGGDFNRDGNTSNDSFKDLPHLEIDE